MIRTINPTGTLYYGQGMVPQMARDLELAGLAHPVVLHLPGSARAAKKMARRMTAWGTRPIPVTHHRPPQDCDALILMGHPSLLERYQSDPRVKILIPLIPEDVAALPGKIDVKALVIDASLKTPQSILEDFFRRFAISAFGALTPHPAPLEIPSSFVFTLNTQGFIGNGVREELPKILQEKGISSPLLLTDHGVTAAGLTAEVENLLQLTEYRIFDNIPPDSDASVVNAISQVYRETGRDGLVLLGGGSVLDTGKGVAMNIGLGAEDLAQWAGSNRLPPIDVPVIALPTTSGTGSEVTKAAVISDPRQGRKSLYISNELQPDHALIDSEFTQSLPPHLTGMTGMDALSHAMEAYTGLAKNPISDQLSWHAIDLIRKHLIMCLKEPQNPTHRQAMAEASTLAGAAFSNSMVAMVHSLGHSMGALCHLPHGLCMAILLAPVLEYNKSAISQELAALSPILTGVETQNQSHEELVDASIAAVKTLNHQLHEQTEERHPLRFSQIRDREGEQAVLENHLPQVARTAIDDASVVYNPVEMDAQDALQVLQKCW